MLVDVFIGGVGLTIEEINWTTKDNPPIMAIPIKQIFTIALYSLVVGFFAILKIRRVSNQNR